MQQRSCLLCMNCSGFNIGHEQQGGWKQQQSLGTAADVVGPTRTPAAVPQQQRCPASVNAVLLTAGQRRERPCWCIASASAFSNRYHCCIMNLACSRKFQQELSQQRSVSRQNDLTQWPQQLPAATSNVTHCSSLFCLVALTAPVASWADPLCCVM